MLFWLGKHILIGPWLRLFFRPKVEGLENIPESGPAILAGNHLSFSDSVFVPLVVKRRVYYLAKTEYFHGRGVKGFFSKFFFRAVGAVPIDRSSGSAAQAALDTGERILREGGLLGIYPEGTRSPDGKLYRGKTGVARMALRGEVPVIPVVMFNTDLIQPIGRRFPRIMRVRMRFGEPLDFSRYEGLAGDRFVERSVTDELMETLRQMSGRRYVDMYAAKVKARIERSHRASAQADRRSTQDSAA